MTTSGTLISKRPIAELIRKAFSYCQINVEEEAQTAEEYQTALDSANQMLRSWQAQGFHLWQYKEAILFLERNRDNYPLNGLPFSFSDDTGYESREVMAFEADKVAKCELIAELTSGFDEIDINFNNFYDDDGVFYAQRALPPNNSLVDWVFVIQVPDGTIYWDVVTQDQLLSNPSTDVNHRRLTINYELPYPPDLEGDYIYPIGTRVYMFPPDAYINDAQRVLDVRRVQMLRCPSENETPINLVSHQEWQKLPNKNSPGAPNQVTFDRLKNYGVFRVWQPPANEMDYQIAFTYERTFEAFVNVSDTADFDMYWEDAFTWNLANRLAIEYRIDSEVARDIQMQADKTLNDALHYDNANYNVRINLNSRIRR